MGRAWVQLYLVFKFTPTTTATLSAKPREIQNFTDLSYKNRIYTFLLSTASVDEKDNSQHHCAKQNIIISLLVLLLLSNGPCRIGYTCNVERQLLNNKTFFNSLQNHITQCCTSWRTFIISVCSMLFICQELYLVQYCVVYFDMMESHPVCAVCWVACWNCYTAVVPH